MSTTDRIQLPGALTSADAERMAADIVPSWVELFGSPATAPTQKASPAASASPAKSSYDSGSGKAVAASRSGGSPIQATIPETPNTSGVASRADSSLQVPTTGNPWAKVLAGAALLCVVGAGAMMMTGGDDPEPIPGDTKAVAPPTASDTLTAGEATSKPDDTSKANPPEAEPEAAEEKAAASAEPEEEPEPAPSAEPEKVEEEPEAEPVKKEPEPEPPKAAKPKTPKPVAKPVATPPRPKPRPRPAAKPRPKPRKPKKPASIAREVPF